jgi:hypothetical protein
MILVWRKNMKNNRLISILALALVAIMMLSVFTSCSGQAPEIESLRERFVYLIEESKQLNILFFGSGLPVYRRDEPLSNRKMVYFVDETAGYNRIMDNSPYFSIDEMKQACENVYSNDYREDLYESAFDGVMTGESSAYVRFYDNGRWLCQNVNATNFKLSERIYDYSTMQVIEPYAEDYINVSIESYTLADSTRRLVYLSFIYENGNWYLDSPTY